MFEFNGKNYTLEQIKAEAQAQGVDPDKFLEFLKTKGLQPTSTNNMDFGEDKREDVGALRPIRPDEVATGFGRVSTFDPVEKEVDPTLESEVDLSFRQQMQNVGSRLSPTWQNFLDQTVLGASDVVQNLFGDEAAYKALSPRVVGEFFENFNVGPFTSRYSKEAYKVKSYYDPSTNEIVNFNEEAFDKDGIDAVENEKYFNLAKRHKENRDDIKLFDARTNRPFVETYASEAQIMMNQVNKRISEFKPITDPGVTGFTDAVKKGEIDDAVVSAANFVLDMSAQMVAARVTKGKSMGAIMYGTSWKTYNDEKSKALYGEDDPDRIKKLIENGQENTAIPATLGAVGYALEKFGMDQITSAMLKKSGKGFVATTMKAQLTEGGTEYLQGLVEKFNEGLGQQKSAKEAAQGVADYMFSEEAADQFFAGLIGGGTMSAGGQAVQAAFRRDETSNQFVNEKIKTLAELEELKARTFDKKQRKQYDKAIKQVTEDLKDHLKRNKKVSDYLSEKQRNGLINILDQNKATQKQINDLNKLFNKGVISAEEYMAEKEALDKKNAEQKKAINRIKNDANMSLVMQDLDASGKLIKDLGVVEQRVFKTESEFLKALKAEYLAQGKTEKQFKQDTEGYSIDGLKIGNVMFVNAEVAAQKNTFGTGTHELLHGVLKSTLQADDGSGDLNAKGVKIVTDFIESLSSREKSYIEKKLKEGGYKINADGTEKQFKEYGEEYLNFYAQGTKENAFTLSAVEKAGKKIASIFKTQTEFKNLNFEDGNQTKEFLNAFVADSKKGIYRQEFAEMAKEGAAMKQGDVKKSMTAQQRTTAENEIKRLGREGLIGDNLREEGIGKVLFDASFEDIYSRIKSEGYLDNLIAAKYKGDTVPRDFVDKVYSELTSHAKNFNPEQNDDFFGYLNSQIANKAGNVYNREYKVDQTAAGRARDIGETTQEGEVKVQVEADTDTALEALETEDLSVAGQARAQVKEGGKQSKFRRAIGFETGGKNYNNILDATKKSLALAYRKTQDIKDPAKRAKAIKKILREEYFTKGLTSDVFKPLKNFLGTKDYIKNLKQHREAIVEAISTADFVQIERKVPDNERIFTTFVRKLTSKKEVEDAVNRDLLPLDALNKIDKGQAVNLYKKRMPTEAEFIEFADQPAINPVTGARSGLKGTRKDGFAKAMGNTLVLDAVMEARQSDDVIGLIDQDVQADLDIQELSAAIGRDVDIKFSLSFNDDIKEFRAAIKKYGVDEVLTPTGRIRKKGGKPVFGLNTPKYITDFYADLADDRPGQFEFFVHELDPKGFKRVQDRLPKGATKGDVYEALMQELSHQTFAKELGLKVYSKDQVVKAWPKIFEDKINKNDIPDIIIWDGKKNGVLFTIETKVGPARAGSYAWNDISFNKVDANGNWIKEWPMAELLSSEQLRQLSEPLIEPIKKLTSVLNINSAQDVVSIPDHLSVGRNGKGENKNLKFAVRSTTSVDANFLREYYNSGKVKLIGTNAIQIQGVGIFHLGNDVHNLEALGINQLEGTFDLTVRIMPRSVKKRINKKDVTIGYRYGLRAELQLRKSRITSEATLDLGRAADTERIAQHVVNQTSARERSVEKAILASRSINSKTELRGMSTFDFDETLIIDGKNFITATKGDDVVKISSGDWPLVGSKYAEQGYDFDFSDFVNVRGGVDGPLLQKMKNQIKKYGPDNVYVLTARPAESATAIHEWLKSKDVNIPLSNITGLGNSTGEAKALWMLDKFAEGYNDMYFVDDALPNVKAVKNVLDQLDIKGKSVQAKIKFSKSMNDDFNKMLERTKGVPFEEAFSRARALKLGKNKGKLQVFVPPSADDFEGLLYYFVGKGEQGNKDLEFFKQAVIDPFSRAYTELDQSRQTIINDWNNLRKRHSEVANKLGDLMPASEFTFDNAIRVYLYNKAGHDIPGLSEQEVENMVERVKTDKALLAFAENLQVILKLDDVYVKPNEYWTAGSTASDVQEVSEKIRRAEFLSEWIENKNEIFNEANLNKIEATYGSRFRSAFEDVLYRMETGRTRSSGSADAISNRWMRWLNNSVGAIMFINTKSVLLQTISMVNYVNYVDNNPYQAAKAFANQKQYWADFAMIFNSDFLKQRRKGLKTDVQAAEIASAVANATNKAQAAVAYLLKKGFAPTQMADSFAIAAGGATFYRNRVKTYLNEGLSQKEAEEKAFNDFRNSTEESQQSARPDRISQQQVSNAGRLLLNFQNYPMQQARLFKKAILGLARGTGNKKEHLSRIVFYGFAQNMIFLSLQNALFAMLFDHEDEEEEQKLFDTKMERILNGMVDTMLRGSGITGGVIATAKNTLLTAIKELDKKGRGGYGPVVVEGLNLSPAIGSKFRKIAKGYNNYSWNRDAVNEMSKLDIDNPIWTTAAPVIEGVTNAPTDRSIRLINQVREAFNTDNTVAERMTMFLGFSPYEAGVKPVSDKRVDEAKKKGKEKGKAKKKQCRAYTSSGKACQNTTTNKSGRCYAHD